MVHINTLLVDQVLSESDWAQRMTEEGKWTLNALFWSNINPYGVFHLDKDSSLAPADTLAA